MNNKILVIFLVGALLIAFTAPGCAEKPKIDFHKIAKNIIKAMNSGDPASLTGLYAPDAVMIMPGETEPVRGGEDLLKYFKNLYRAVPDLKFEATLILVSGDHIVMEFVFSGTFTGPLFTPEGDLAPTGNSVKMRSVTLFKISTEGLISEDRTYYDTFDHMKQLGLLK